MHEQANCGAEGQPCCVNSKFDSDKDMCPGAIPGGNQTLTCSVLEDYQDDVTAPAMCVPCGKRGQECCVGSNRFFAKVCDEGPRWSRGTCPLVPCMFAKLHDQKLARSAKNERVQV
jgi:hypothetical protein